MLQALIDNGPHMAVGQGIKHRLTLPAALYQPVLLQNPQLVGYGGLVHIEQLRDIADAHLRLK